MSSGGWMHAWLRLVARAVPADERPRWLEEWSAEIDSARARGARGAERIHWAAGVALAALRFRGETMTMDGWGRDVRHALRGLLRRPGFAAVTVLTLGLGIGANTAIFSVVNGVLLRPLPYEAPERLVAVHSAFPTLDFDKFWISPPEYVELAERTTSFDALGGYREGLASVGGGEQPERVSSAIATAELFDVLGVEPVLGRTYTPEEDVPDGPGLVVLSHEIWMRLFGGDPTVIGRAIDVNAISRTVLGVMPPGFDLDDKGIEVWIPAQLDRVDRVNNRGSHYLLVIGRLKEGVGRERAASELTELVAGWAEQNPDTHVPSPDNHPFFLTAFQDEVVGDVRQALFLLLGAVGFVLLIACANVGNLLLARSEDRQKEVAVRVAMGAGRNRLLRQFLTEGVVLAGAGAALGVAIAYLSLEALRAMGPGDIPRLGEVALDGRVLLFTGAVALVTGVFFGLAPARHATRSSPAGGGLREGGGRTTSSAARTRLRSLLVVSEMALAMMLAVGAGLMIRSFQQLTDVDPGFDGEGVLTWQIFLPTARYPETSDAIGFHQRMEQALSTLPGVASYAVMSGLPPVRDLNANDTQFEGMEPGPNTPPQNVDYYQTVSADYFETMRIPLVRGRGFERSDTEDGVPVAVVNETLANLYYPGEDALGKRIRPCCGDEWYEVVGVAADVKQGGLDQPVGTELYLHFPQAAANLGVNRSMNVALRTAGDPEALARTVRQTMGGLDATLPLAGMQSMERVVTAARARPRFLTLVMGGFAALALLLAAVGTYGVMSYSVAQREKEVGIRMALGAEGSTVLALVLRQGLAVTGLGIGVGLLGAWALSGLLQSMLFEVPARDVATFVLGPAVLAVAALLALWIPARRATRVNPVEVLRDG